MTPQNRSITRHSRLFESGCFAPAIMVLLAGFCLIASTAVRAQNAQDTFKWPQEKLKAYNTHGLGQDDRPYKLTAAIGLNMTHANARQFIRVLPKNYRSAPLRNLVISALIARIDGESITQQDPVPAGKDLLTLRLEALNAMGAYTYAFRLYAALKSDIAHAQLLKAGIRAQLGLGRYSLACLEAKAGIESLDTNNTEAIEADSSFWRQMHKLCRPVIGQPLLKNSKQKQGEDSQPLVMWEKDSNRPTSWAELNGYSMPEMAYIMRNHAGALTAFDDAPDSLDTRHLAMLTHIAEAPLALKFEFMRIAASRNLVTSKRWRKFLNNANTRLETDSTKAERAELSRPFRHLLKLSTHDSAAQRGETTPSAISIAQTFAELYGQVPMSALLAFESLLNKAPTDREPGPRVRNTVLITFLRANRYLQAKDWGIGKTPINDAAQATKDNHMRTRQYELLALFALRDQDFSGIIHKYLKACTNRKACNLPGYGFLQDFAAFQKRFNLRLAKSISPDIAYDKEKGLTFRSRYVIPSVSLREDVKEKNLKKGLGKAIFLGTLALHRENKDKLDPYFTASVLNKLSNAGINRFGRDFAITYLIGTLEKKE